MMKPTENEMKEYLLHKAHDLTKQERKEGIVRMGEQRKYCL